MTYQITLSDQEYAALAAAAVGVHYPGDILGGAIDGTVAACVATALRRWLQQPTSVALQFAQKLKVT